jgi:hypothetical protein
MQLALRRYQESRWRLQQRTEEWHPSGSLLDMPAGWGGAAVGAAPGRSKLVLEQGYYDDWYDRDTFQALIDGRLDEGSRRGDDAGSGFESGFTSSEEEEEAEEEGDGAAGRARYHRDKDALCGTVEHLEALAAPFPFHARTKAALGPRLLDTLHGLRGADAELPPGWRDEVESLAPWPEDAGYDAYVARKYGYEEEDDDDEDVDEGEVRSRRRRLAM